jgi:methyl-accepting chemotaxis protein
MKENTKVLFLRPLLLQESITALVVVPMLLFIFMNISAGVKSNFMSAAMGGSAAANLGLILGFLVNYLMVSPALKVMEKESSSQEEIRHAVRLAALMPLLESITVFLRFALFGNLIAILPMYLKGYVNQHEMMAGYNSLIMTGLLAMPFFYLASENSLVPFYQRCNMKGIMDSRGGIFRMSLNNKLISTILLMAISPVGLIMGLIYLSVENGLKLGDMKAGFALILVQTVLMTFINAYLITRSHNLSVGKMSVMFEDMAKGQGDLTKRLHVSGLNEVGKLAYWFNQFIEDIEQIISHVKTMSMQLHGTIEDVSSGSQDLSQATQEQAASVEEISASIEQMNGMVNHNAGLVSEGKETSNAVTKLIDHSRSLFSDLSRAIEEISQDSRKIGDIVSTVNEVAFHTNLLALNASVEAARAGEHGKGFAVVAGEVRSLAQRSAEAASEIKGLIEGTVDRIKNGDE